jgi:predicted nuclease of predicted toxin-antitoxin system
VKFKIDENLPVETSVLFSSCGHDALTVNDQHLVGESDSRILDVCDREMRVLITLDLDFADIRTYAPQEHFGIVVLRLNRQDKQHVLFTVQTVIPLFEKEEVRNRLWVVEEDKIRIRGG